jgi:hypothetical protein
MLSIQQDPSGCRRRAPRTDTDLDLERRGRMSDLSPDDRAAIVRTAELLGCDIAAEHIRGDAHRRRLVQAAPEPAPRPGPKPRATAPTPPLLRVHDGGGQRAADPDEAWWDDVRRVWERHDLTALSLPGRLVHDAVAEALRVIRP